jgi:methionyl-tRNA formyltransferase
MEEIYACGGRLELVHTLTDSQAVQKSGRVFVDDFCAGHHIPVVKGRNINDAAVVASIEAARLDWLFIIGWSQIAGDAVLGATTRGVLGIHPTLLPQGRGRAAIPWAILKGLQTTGVTLFKLDANVDTGPIIAQKRIKVDERETATTLYEKVAVAHRDVIRGAWPDLAADAVGLRPQDETLASYWPARTPADGELSATVAEIDRLVRAATRPYPGAFIKREHDVLRIWAGRPVKGFSERASHGPLVRGRDGTFEAEQYSSEPLEDQ